MLDRLTTLFVWLLDERGGKERAWGIGLALPEPITVDAWDNFAAGDGALSRLQAWRNFDFAGELSLRFGAPSWSRSGTQTMTIGELEAGAGRGASDLLFVNSIAR